MTEMKRYDYAIQRLLPNLWLRGYDFAERGDRPLPGDLVMLQSAPQSDWHLSWYVKGEGDRHLLESLKTGELCNWTNVGFVIMNRKWVSEHECIKWTDRQFAFEKTFRAEFKKADFYIHLPYIERFDGHNVFITFRVRYGFNDTLTKAEAFNIEGASRGDLRNHLWKWLSIHKKIDEAASAAKKAAAMKDSARLPS
jgi:hypothetical protein